MQLFLPPRHLNLARRSFGWRHWIGVLALTTLAMSCGVSKASAQPAFPLHTAGPYIVDSNGYRVRLNAFNWYGTDSTDYVVAGLQTASLSSIVTEIKSLDFSAVRLPWSNQMYESNPVVANYALAANPSLEGENALTIFDQVISALTSAGIMVILDNHTSNAEWCCSTTDRNELWYNSSYPETSWISDWEPWYSATITIPMSLASICGMSREGLRPGEAAQALIGTQRRNAAPLPSKALTLTC